MCQNVWQRRRAAAPTLDRELLARTARVVVPCLVRPVIMEGPAAAGPGFDTVALPRD